MVCIVRCATTSTVNTYGMIDNLYDCAIFDYRGVACSLCVTGHHERGNSTRGLLVGCLGCVGPGDHLVRVEPIRALNPKCRRLIVLI